MKGKIHSKRGVGRRWMLWLRIIREYTLIQDARKAEGKIFIVTSEIIHIKQKELNVMVFNIKIAAFS